MKHIKNYAKVKKKLKEYFDLLYHEARRNVDKASSWKAKGQLIDTDFVKRCHEYLEKDLPDEEKYWTERLEAADKAGKLTEIKISVNWIKSRLWGSNPHAECWVSFEDAEYGSRSSYSEGRASGCGYDKRSAAVQEAFEFGTSKKRDDADRRKALALAKASLDRFVIEHGEDLWKEYAIDESPMPHFNISGKGMSTFTGLFRRIGHQYSANFAVKDYLIDYSEPDRGSDVYHVIRKDRV